MTQLMGTGPLYGGYVVLIIIIAFCEYLYAKRRKSNTKLDEN